MLAGPYATRLLADFGAEVIKVLPPSPPPGDTFSQGYYNTWNRNKLGITLDLDKAAGKKIVRQLVGVSDAVIENFSPRVMSNWGLDYPRLKRIKKDIIFLSLSMMGHSGPRSHFSGYGPAVQAFSGITYLTSYPDRPPAGIGFSYADHVAGLYASLALLGALEYRQRTGQGRYIDLSETEIMSGLVLESIRDSGLKEKEAGKNGNQDAPGGIYPCSGIDRWCAIAVSSEGEWEGLKKAMGSPAWAQECRFADKEARLSNSAALDELISGWTARHSPEELTALLQQEGVPAGTVQNARDLANDPQLRARGFFKFSDHPPAGDKLADAPPLRLSASQAEYRRPAPGDGRDDDYVFRQLLGMSEEQLLRYRREGVICGY